MWSMSRPGLQFNPIESSLVFCEEDHMPFLVLPQPAMACQLFLRDRISINPVDLIKCACTSFISYLQLYHPFRQIPSLRHHPRILTEGPGAATHIIGSKTVAYNFRSASLTSILCKVLEFSMRNAAAYYFHRNHLINDNQHLVSPGRSRKKSLLSTMGSIENFQQMMSNYMLIFSI